MRHASFFSGVGGLDLGFERAGIQTVSVCEIDPYASSVLAERFPDAPNLGSITEINADDIPEADIWSGGFPCQDLSVAGKRAGFAGKRSSLAFTFLDLVERRRPRWLVLENVPGLFSSNKGADFARLLYEMEQLGYGVAWRTLDARYFGVAQRRRRVFIVASLGSDRAGEVLFECEGCERHPSPRLASWQGATAGAPDGSGIASALTRRFSKGVNSTVDEPLIVGQAPDADGVRAADGMARRVDDQQRVDTFGAQTHRALQARDWKGGVSNQDIGQEGYLVGSLTGGGSDSPQSERIFDERGAAPTLDTERAIPQVFRKSARVNSPDSPETWVDDGIANTLNSFDVGDVRTTHAVLSFPSRFGSNANVTEDQAQSMAHSAGAPAVFRKAARAQSSEDSETWVEGDVANTLNGFDVGDVRTTHAIVSAFNIHSGSVRKDRPEGGMYINETEQARTLDASGGLNPNKNDGGLAIVGTRQSNDDDLLPMGLDSHRYRCCGNGVVANVAEWIGIRIIAADVLD